MDSLKESIGVLSAAIVGSFIGTASKRNDDPLTMAISVVAGISTAYIFTPIIIINFGVSYKIDDAVAFVLGLFGMYTISIIMAILDVLKNNPMEFITFSKDIFTKSKNTTNTTTTIINNYKEEDDK